MSVASEEELMKAVTESLNEMGSLSKLTAITRAEVLTVLNSKNNEIDKDKIPRLNSTVNLINELIREYLTWLDYRCTSSTLIAESGMSDAPVPRSVLLRELNVQDKGNSSDLPVLLSLVSTFKNMPSVMDHLT
ncbi:centrosomal protein 20-like [Lycorma delicatula]|uniref:centrosomal protein 20-like n=1 Tax=Lycorma delicatula TaxID=130591 RepID=UPI003F5147EE